MQATCGPGEARSSFGDSFDYRSVCFWNSRDFAITVTVVVVPNKKRLRLELRQNDLVASLKSDLAARGLLLFGAKVTFKGEELSHDLMTLKDCGISDGSELIITRPGLTPPAGPFTTAGASSQGHSSSLFYPD